MTKLSKLDSSSDAKYHSIAKETDEMRKVLRKNLKPYGIDLSSKFAQASLSAMKEYMKNYHERNN